MPLTFVPALLVLITKAVSQPAAMLIAVSEPAPGVIPPMLIAFSVKFVPAVTPVRFKPLKVHVPGPQVVNVGATLKPVIVLVAAPLAALTVGETSKPLVVLVTAEVVVSLKVKVAKLPVSDPV